MKYNILEKKLIFLDNKTAKMYFEEKRIAPAFFFITGALPEASSVNVDESSGLSGAFSREVNECVVVRLTHLRKI
jgi:hypothetical protein